MKYKIVSDSSSNILTLKQIPFASVPLHIIVDEHQFIDDETVDLVQMEKALSSCKGSSTACPGPSDWLNAFGDSETIFCVTITSALSGSFSSARIAKQDYEEKFPSRHVYIIDSLSTGPEMELIIEKLQEFILSGKDEKTIYDEILSYTKHTHLLFALESLTNLANNGRINRTIAKIAGVLGIRVIGQASSQGELELLDKCRGEQRALSCVIKRMKEMGYNGGKVRIVHNNNKKAAQKLMSKIQETFKVSDICIAPTRALCSYYAEKGGLIIGFEEE
ncbi:MAG: DegV family protein [Eubacterium sp.]